MKNGEKTGIIISLMLLVSILMTGGVLAISPECESDIDCDDKDSCTIDTCVEGFCYNDFSDNVKPDTEVIFATRDNGEDKEVCEDGKIYVNFDADDIVINFYSEDICSNLKNAEYLRSGLNTYWNEGEGLDDSKKTNYWYTDPYDNWPNEEYRVCGRALDFALNQENDGLSINDVPDDDCCVLCIDITAPIMNSISDNTEDCDDYSEMNYWNDDEITWSWTAHDSPDCGEIDYYIVKLYDSEGIVDTQTIDEPDAEATFDELEDGETYYVEVYVFDKAGNPGTHITSDEVIIDLTNPIVTITGPDNSDWFDPGFDVSETDVDDNLDECYYRIYNDGDYSLDWTLTNCNEDVFIDVESYCTVDGDCEVEKKAEDKACNIGTDSRTFLVDTHEPVVDKDVGELKWEGRLFEWLDEFFDVDWFITDQTTITLSCDDGQGSGVQSIIYSINQGTEIIVNDGDTEDEDSDDNEVEIIFTLSPDGIYELEYYCIDNVDKESVHEFEIDKVDTEAPITTKIIGEPNYYNEDTEEQWVSCDTGFELTCEDTEVGCDETEYLIECEDGQGILQIYDDVFNLEGFEECSWVNLLWWSSDYLENKEETNSETDLLDCEAPEIIIHNPTCYERKWHIERCDQSVVVEIWDEKSGVDEESVYAELYDESDVLVRTVNLTKAVYKGENGDIYEGLMNKELPAGDYVLIVYADDNLRNKGEAYVEEELQEGIYVEYIDALCILDIEQGGDCDFEFHLCMRGDNDIQMWMDKLAEDPGLITPDMLGAEISSDYDEEDPAYVGLAHIYEWFGHQKVDKVSDAEELMLDGDVINGKTTFDLSLTITPEIAGMIGIGTYDLEYYLESPEDVI